MDYEYTQITPKKYVEYNCENCNFNTSNKKDYNRHLKTVKHKKIMDKLNDNYIPENIPKIYTCKKCNKNYKHAPTLSRHKKTCSLPKQEKNNNNQNINLNNDKIQFQKISLDHKEIYIITINNN